MGKDEVGSERGLGRENMVKVDYMKEIVNKKNPSNLHSVQKTAVVLWIEPHLAFQFICLSPNPWYLRM